MFIMHYFYFGTFEIPFLKMFQSTTSPKNYFSCFRHINEAPLISKSFKCVCIHQRHNIRSILININTSAAVFAKHWYNFHLICVVDRTKICSSSGYKYQILKSVRSQLSCEWSDSPPPPKKKICTGKFHYGRHRNDSPQSVFRGNVW